MKKEKLLSEVLIYTKLPKLPDNDYVSRLPWLKAIIETKKADGSESYCVAKTIDGENFRVIKDFGSVSPIVEYGKVYPFSHIREKYIPNVNSKEELLQYLVSVYGEDKEKDIRSMSDKDLKSLTYREAVRLSTINDDYETRMFEEKKKYLDNVKAEDDAMKESTDEEYLENKEKLIDYQKKAVKNEGTKKQKRVRKTAK